ncbi:hypothetical protein B4064_0509 [Caldibacillus thermoamylovorans]|nr:hypothetical protein B4064_0509 [Caldibacillus thermoamylovorans]
MNQSGALAVTGLPPLGGALGPVNAGKTHQSLLYENQV